MRFEDALLLFQYNQMYLSESLYDVIINSDMFNNQFAEFTDGHFVISFWLS